MFLLEPISDAGIGFLMALVVLIGTAAVHFVTVSCGVVDQCAIAWVPGIEPPPRGKTRLTPIGDGWYHLYSVF